MKHAVIFTIHNNTKINRLFMQCLDDERFVFILLLDKKSCCNYTDFIPELRKAKTVTLPRININWGGYSMIEAELRLIEAALEEKVDYIHYVQGADMPLKTAEAIDFYCKEHSGEEFINLQPENYEFARYKVLCRHLLADNRYFRTSRIVKMLNHGIAHMQKPFMRDEKVYHGSALFSISKEFAKHVISQREPIHRRYRYGLAADECFLQDMIMKSEGFNKHISKQGNARLIDWKNREGNSPHTFTMADITTIEAAIENENLLFVRKIDENKDSEIAEHIYSIIKEKQSTLPI